jgi:hypothetical protein
VGLQHPLCWWRLHRRRCVMRQGRGRKSWRPWRLLRPASGRTLRCLRPPSHPPVTCGRSPSASRTLRWTVWSRGPSTSTARTTLVPTLTWSHYCLRTPARQTDPWCVCNCAIPPPLLPHPCMCPVPHVPVHCPCTRRQPPSSVRTSATASPSSADMSICHPLPQRHQHTRVPFTPRLTLLAYSLRCTVHHVAIVALA